MSTLEATFASGAALAVHEFTVREAVSDLFVADLVCRTPDPGVDLEALVGKTASFHARAGYDFALGGGERHLSGVVALAELVHAVSVSGARTGLSTYRVRIMPALWTLGERRNHRVFQHLSIPDIVERLLGEWGIAHRFSIDRAAYPPSIAPRTRGSSTRSSTARATSPS
jgi:type VI secretion system secreted protein VgrG